MQDPVLAPHGTDGILVRFADVLSEEANARAIGFSHQVAAANVAGVVEVTPSLLSVRIGFDPQRTNREMLAESLTMLLQRDGQPTRTAKRLWRIPTAFGDVFAPQLAEAATLAGMTKKQAIRQMTSTRLRVIAIGFAPGQPYLGMLPPAFDIPRQTALTDRLPRGALICAVSQLIIWAADAPTGWRHIGQTCFDVYRPNTADPFAFQPGDFVEFEPVSDMAMRDLQGQNDPNGGAVCEALT